MAVSLEGEASRLEVVSRLLVDGLRVDVGSLMCLCAGWNDVYDGRNVAWRDQVCYFLGRGAGLGSLLSRLARLSDVDPSTKLYPG